MKKADGFVVEPSEKLKLDEIYSSFPALYLGNEAGRSSEFLSDLSLRELRMGPRLLELSSEAPVRRAVERLLCLRHRLSLREEQAYNAGAIAPKIGAKIGRPIMGRILAVILFCFASAGCASTKQYTMKRAWQDQTTMTAMRSKNILTAGGEIRGKLKVKGDAPKEIKMDVSFGDNDWQPVDVRQDNSFWTVFHRTLDFADKPFPDSIPIKFRFPWEDELKQTGEAYRPSPDSADYRFVLKPGRTIQLLDSSGAEVSAIGIALSYEKLIDKERKEQIRLDAIKAQKAAEDEAEKETMEVAAMTTEATTMEAHVAKPQGIDAPERADLEAREAERQERIDARTDKIISQLDEHADLDDGLIAGMDSEHLERIYIAAKCRNLSNPYYWPISKSGEKAKYEVLQKLGPNSYEIEVDAAEMVMGPHLRENERMPSEILITKQTDFASTGAIGNPFYARVMPKPKEVLMANGFSRETNVYVEAPECKRLAARIREINEWGQRPAGLKASDGTWWSL